MGIFIFLIISLAIQIILFVPAFIKKTDKLTDLSYSLSFGALAYLAFIFSSQQIWHWLLLFMVVLWAGRLGSYLFIRIQNIKRDKRFDGVREDFWKFLKFWLGQGVVVWLVMIPNILFFTKDVEADFLMIVGFLIWLTGLIVEALADCQKYNFINNLRNKGKWIDKGLWKYSRHPNYFGEILHWLGIYIFTFSSLNFQENLYSLVSPLFIIFILLFVTGIPPLERQADKRWGNDDEYIKYKKNTSILIPWFKK